MGQSEVDGKRVGKFGQLDTQYLAKRKALSEALGPQELFSIVDHMGLYTGTMTLARNLQFMEMVRATLTVPGDIVEFGCWKGSTLLLFAKLLAIWDAHGIKRTLGFSRWDTGFEPHEWGPEDNPEVAEFYRDACKGELALLHALIDLNGLTGAVETYNGDIGDTWPQWLVEHPNRFISLAYADMDLYRPTKIALTGLHERLLPGAIVAFDQAQHVDWSGEGKAAMEFLDEHRGEYEVRHAVNARQPELILVKR